MWDLIVSVPVLCLSFYFPVNYLNLCTCRGHPTMQYYYSLSTFIEDEWVECSNVLSDVPFKRKINLG